LRKKIDLSAPDAPPLPKVGSPVTTACKGAILYEVDTPSAFYRGERFFFCLTSCLKTFLDNPETSCLAEEIKRDNG
jgi:YHS domain-containing protein